MKTFSKFLLTVLPLVAIMISACNVMAGQPYLTKEFTISTPGELEVVTSGGSIDVSSHSGDKVRVEMFVRKGGRSIESNDNDAAEALEDFEIEIEKSGNKVIASASREGGSWFSSNNVSISFKVLVPKQMSCDLKTSGGSIQLTGVSGNQDVATSGGSLTLADISGDMDATTSGGSINIKNYEGLLEASTSGGSINLSNAKGELAVKTSGGSINLEDVEGSLTARTSGGGIKANLSSLDKQLKLSTSGGSITAVIPGGLGLDLDLKGNRVNTKLSNFDGEVEKDRVVGSINGGGIPVVMSTSGGSVNLEYR